MAKSQLNRQQCETALLAAIGLFGILCLRFPIEPRVMLAAEVIGIAIGFCGLVVARSNENRRWTGLCCVLVVAMPVLNAFVSRVMGSPIAFELTAMTTFGAIALALSVMNQRPRAMSLVASGFLTLFGTVISDHPNAIALAIVWMAVCVWHLVANHWERIELCAADNVSRSGSMRPLTVIAAVFLFIVGGMFAKDRFGDSNHLQAGFMPTSGGSEWSDPAATHGIGSGDAAIAAKDHAESFGAVESDLFLESTDSTLFDMFSDSIGQPKKKTKWERRQGMSSEKVIEAHTRSSRSEQGSASFSTDRDVPKKHRHLADVAKNALVQWSGPTGIRLAMNRYNTFDGLDWTNTAKHRQKKFARKQLGEQIWFFEPETATKILGSPAEKIARGELKFIRLNTTRLPVPMMTSGVHIKQVDRQDFFSTEEDGSFFMPGRERVPPLTVVHVAGMRVLEDELIAGLNGEERAESIGTNDTVNAEIADLVQAWTGNRSAGNETPYEKLKTIVKRLRTDFQFDRDTEFDSERPITEFLLKRRGGDHLFATTAALMAREIGLQSRLVTGLYVRPSSVDIAAGHSNVLPDDVHSWVEIRLKDGRWFEIEPTPSFREPVYAASWWLQSRRFAAQFWPIGLAASGLIALVYVTRLVWLEFLLTFAWWASVVCGPRRRFAFAVRIVETRAAALGHSRPAGSPPREWLLHRVAGQVAGRVAGQGNSDNQVNAVVRSFCDLADRLYFGKTDVGMLGENHSRIASGFVGALPIRTLKTIFGEDPS